MESVNAIEIDSQEMDASGHIDISYSLAIDLIFPPAISKESENNGIKEMEPTEYQREERQTA